ncbi:nucleoside hydrolase [Pseudactinotalea sp. HY160]|uniref:nucleoside hydrolase n=1 Tax=Pseudactinotalea sp. HY160 TaxID=2654490 RepID=UPI00128E2A78|nr:nucleoside hydrolase [Pseudactinotalea sp. HY160]MPV48975.1 nucleoside hydrolase [Pseudactinotalea sp. HY160]
MAAVPLLVDVDTGIDDSLALLYLLAGPEAELVAITCTAGNVPARQVATNNLAWLELCSHPPVEVALGAEVPIVQALKTTEETHGPQGIGYAELPAPTRSISERHAAQVWIEEARRRPGELTGLVTGPLTNLALAVTLEPDLPHLLRRVVLMGGAFNHPGNTAPTTEWNIAVDPEAAKIVFDRFAVAANRPIVCGLDVTERIAMTPEHLRRLAEAAGSTPVELLRPDDGDDDRSRASNVVIKQVSDAVRFYLQFHRDSGRGFIAHMHDPFAAAVALDPTIAVLRPATVDVELAGTLTRGQTVADWDGLWGRQPNADVVVDAAPADFLDAFIERVGALARRVG